MANGEHKNEVKLALEKLNAAITNLEGTKKHIDNQLEIIPNYFAKKDELGENTQKYIEEISENLQTNLIDKLKATSQNEDTFLGCAVEMDAQEDETERTRKEMELSPKPVEKPVEIPASKLYQKPNSKGLSYVK